jgi:2-phosphoglycerate kinase
MEHRSLPDRLRHVLLLGGGSGAGKSTIARRLADAFGLAIYDTDQAMADHDRRCAPKDCPALTAFKAMDMDARWLDRSPEAMFETFHWFRGEAFGLIVEDLLARPPDRPVIVEGFRLLPRLVAPLLKDRAQAAFLIPTPAFRRAAFESRGGLMAIAGQTRDPDRALRNLLERDAMFTARVAREAREAGLAVIDVGDDMTVEDLTARVSDQFGPAITPPPPFPRPAPVRREPPAPWKAPYRAADN